MRRSSLLPARIFTIALTLVALMAPARATDPEGAEPMRVLVLDFSATGVDDVTTATVARIVASELATHAELQVLAADDLRRAMALEGEKQTLDCDTESCIGEIANAMGARLVVFGDVGRIDDDVVLTLTLFDAHAATTRHKVSRTTTLAGVSGAARAAADDIAGALLPSVSPLLFAGVGTLALGALAVVVGSATLGASLWTRTQPTSSGDAKALAGNALWVGAAVAVGGVLVAAVGGALTGAGALIE